MINVHDAIAQCESSLACNPDDLACLNQLAMLEASLGHHVQGLQHLSNALQLAPHHPLLHYNLGKIHSIARRYEDEIQSYRHAIALKPDFADAYVNMGVALRDLQRFDEAFESFKQALRIDPEHAGARTNRAQTNLLLGHFEHGWREYEWRWRDGHQSHDINGSLWNGKTSLKGKRLLIHAEQGLGDTIQFVRYLDLLHDSGAELILRVQPPLAGLLASYPAASKVIETTAPLPEFDLHIPLLSLPHAIFKRHPGIPSRHHYLRVPPEKVAYWSERLAQLQASEPEKPSCASVKQLKIGLCWSGSTHHVNDENRSIRLEQCVPLLEQECVFVAVQKEIREADQSTLKNHPEILNIGIEFKNFEDTAALLCNLDLVITVDTSVAHISAALGIPTWILLPEPPDWRWMLNRTDSPWYPSATIFRQPNRGDWESVMQQVSRQIKTMQSGSNK